MKRVMLLALLAMALPTAALASSIDFSSGDFISGTISGSFTTAVDVSVVGSLNTVSIATGSLTMLSSGNCPVPGAQCFSFTGGTVTVAAGGSTLFTDSLGGGFVIKTGDSVTIAAGLMSSAQLTRGSANFAFTTSGSTLTAGSGGVTAVPTPEPGTLGLLGTGLIGLAAMIRRKLKLPR